MCGRFSLTEALEDLKEYYQFHMREDFDLHTHLNLSPSNQITAIVKVEGKRYPAAFRWGLIPPFAKDEKIGYKTFNARAETVADKPSFRKAFRSKRCLIPASSFYEWKKTEEGYKQPYEIKLLSGDPLTFAGLWESWRNEKNDLIRSCTIITTEPNSTMSKIHDRMPVILSPDQFDQWLNPDSEPDHLKQMLVPFSGELGIAEISGERFKQK
ncbi:SOS response-associated peptidase [Jeotgalibacillus sp. R-1-5s-1]|uniref:SOS response-associated peptidase n=1 Tax=Jeotgalibacillus sp. R-1-5s-1 TaxID=2555897 RepID=UPI00141AE352|nr:SOS response-associated peptidase [Jeotgalibacillus sp. R-1-5s-1]